MDGGIIKNVKIRVEKKKVEEFKTDALLLYHFEGEKALLGKPERIDRATGGLIREVLRSGDFKGDLYQTSLIYNHRGAPARRILTAGLGKKARFSLDRWRGATAKGAQVLRDLGVKTFATTLVEGVPERISLNMLAQALVEGVCLGLYDFSELKTKNRKRVRRIEKMVILEEEPTSVRAVQEGALIGETVVQGVYLARDLVSRPGNLHTPTMMAKTAEGIAKECGLALTVFEEEDARKEGMGAFLAVARGSDEPAKFIVLEYAGGESPRRTVVLVGKGITFDSGGISIKPSDKMQMMKSDMGGPVFAEKNLPYIPKGATGVGVRLLVQLLRDWTN